MSAGILGFIIGFICGAVIIAILQISGDDARREAVEDEIERAKKREYIKGWNEGRVDLLREQARMDHEEEVKRMTERRIL